MEVKICGITQEKEIQYLNEFMPEYAGFVIWEKSKRFVSINQSKLLINKLNSSIKAVSVTVDPSIELIKEINDIQFDILQIHNELNAKMIEECEKNIWYAINISKVDDLKYKLDLIKQLPVNLYNKITAIIIDGAEYGSGKSFDWKNCSAETYKSFKDILNDKKIILAGGLNYNNVNEGIRIFSPDAVDVSSGVEGINGKDRELIKLFIERAKENE